MFRLRVGSRFRNEIPTNAIEFRYVAGVLSQKPLSGILGNIPFLCALCDSAVIVSICLQTEHI
ncbi:hypothetical protein D3OALGA1CA_2610 [Olavius algarvensis associated proteobacterium Delta 3]|nr:hypothetical protein D3OALGA1CA_2610 [Olavius algarvensis associated proteobacterium Delta 3]CAB5145558.1 hypothetical protein D3OALGB2SA_4482 [Olavius algarvensis associated proteobacterium Delta 3]